MGCITILEGPDGGGKSTLAMQLIKNDKRSNIVHHGPYKGVSNIAPYYLSGLRELITHNLVIDRCWLSEQIYGAVFRNGRNRVETFQRRMLERLYLTYQPVVIKCLPSFKQCAETFRQREEYLDNEDQLRQVHELYRFLAVKALPSINYGFTKMSYDDLMVKLNDARPLKNNGPGAGSWKPGKSILLVGDKPNIRTNNSFPRVPFFNPLFNRNGCSAWLADQLEMSGVRENELYWINASNELGRPTSGDFIKELQPSLVIALGSAAYLWCCRNCVKHEVVPHPQYWKRFCKGRRYPLIDILLERRTRDEGST